MVSSSSGPLVGAPSADVEMASSSGDEVIVVRDGPAKQGTKRSYAKLVECDGPLKLALVVGQPEGRWWPELNDDAKACKAAYKHVSVAAGNGFANWPLGTDRLVGLAIVRGWHCILSSASHADTYALIQASEAHHKKRSGQRYLEHEVVAASTLQPFDGNSIHLSRDWAAKPPAIAGPRLLQQITDANHQARLRKGSSVGKTCLVSELLEQWKSEYDVDATDCLAWHLMPELAGAICMGAWYGDVSVRYRRQLRGHNTMAPAQPSVGQLRHFVSMDIDKVLPPLQASAPIKVWEHKRGAIAGYHPEHMLASLRAAQHVTNKEKFKGQLMNCLRFFHPRTWKRVARNTVAMGQVPHKGTLRRNTVRLDMAAMLARRMWYQANGPTYRYLSYDASPQRGVEFFATVERVVRRKDLEVAASAASDNMPVVETRVLPLVVLGSGRMGLAEKTQAHIHQVWLEYGPGVEDVRKANLDVRQCLSDMGTELAIADLGDVVAQCIECHGQSSHRDEEMALLYPKALVVPGPQHIIDTATRRGLEALPWWPEWQRSAKAVCQWLRPASHRQLLQERLRVSDHFVAEGQIKSLKTSCDSFAHWRWKTLATVTRDLVNKKDAVVAATTGMQSASELSSRDGGGAAEFLRAVRDSQFWSRAAALGQLVAPMASFSSWLRGCECHETERLAGQHVACDWQGCRAAGLASRTSQVLEELDKFRQEFSGMSDMVRAASSALASFDMKMSWVRHEPYLVWEASLC